MNIEYLKRVAVILPVALISVGMVLMATYVWTKPRFFPAVYLTSPNRVVPSPTDVCPGETISYTVTVTVRKAPSQVMIVESFWSVDQGFTAVFDDAPMWVAYTEITTFQRPFISFVPALEPGNYELRNVAQEYGAEPTFVVVPFTVRGDC